MTNSKYVIVCFGIITDFCGWPKTLKNSILGIFGVQGLWEVKSMYILNLLTP